MPAADHESPLSATKNVGQSVTAAPLWLLALVTFCGTLAMHIFVPALPQAGTDLGASPVAMQMSVSLYILGLAFGQLVYGPLSDRYGRRRILMGGLVLYTVSGLVAALAPEAQTLIVARLFQALGGCAGLVLGRAILRDTASTTEAGRRLALMNLMVTLGPGVAPLLGSLLELTLGWRAILYFLFAFGAVNLLFALWLLPETGRPAARGGGTSLSRHYFGLLVSRRFLGLAIGGGCVTTATYAFIAAAPYIFTNQLSRPEHEAGFYLAMLVSGVWLGSLVASRLIARMPINRLLVIGMGMSAASAFVFLAAVLTGRLDVGVTIASMFVYTIGVGIASPAALTQAISVNTNVIGSASGLYGFIQMAIGAVCAMLAGIGDDPALAAALVLALSALLGGAALGFAGRQGGDSWSEGA
jgi:DHA1 family bicyclomycin/chloramphenicol resistance-like MFS transporter